MPQIIETGQDWAGSRTEERSNRRDRSVVIVRRLLGGIFLVISLALFAYPAVMSILSFYQQEQVATTVVSVADETADDCRLGYLAQARRYNAGLAASVGMAWADDSRGNGGNAGTKRDIVHEDVLGDAREVAETGSPTSDEKSIYDGIHDEAMARYPNVADDQEESLGYSKQLSWKQSDIMGTLEIPSIGTRLVLRHGTDESTLASGVGHLPTSSLPVGGLSSHCVISGHSGMRTARMLDDLERVNEGDVFLLDVLGDTYAYRVYSVEDMVPPSSLKEHLLIEDGRDLCTLFTCTPYGVNSHRLLVHGERIPYDPDSEDIVWNSSRIYVNKLTQPLIIAVLGAIGLWVIVMVVVIIRRLLIMHAS